MLLRFLGVTVVALSILFSWHFPVRAEGMVRPPFLKLQLEPDLRYKNIKFLAELSYNGQGEFYEVTFALLKKEGTYWRRYSAHLQDSSSETLDLSSFNQNNNPPRLAGYWVNKNHVRAGIVNSLYPSEVKLFDVTVSEKAADLDVRVNNHGHYIKTFSYPLTFLKSDKMKRDFIISYGGGESINAFNIHDIETGRVLYKYNSYIGNDCSGFYQFVEEGSDLYVTYKSQTVEEAYWAQDPADRKLFQCFYQKNNKEALIQEHGGGAGLMGVLIKKTKDFHLFDKKMPYGDGG